jgi:hypothetical protein
VANGQGTHCLQKTSFHTVSEHPANGRRSRLPSLQSSNSTPNRRAQDYSNHRSRLVNLAISSTARLLFWQEKGDTLRTKEILLTIVCPSPR